MTAQKQQVEYYKHRIEALEKRVAYLELIIKNKYNGKIKNSVASAGNGRQWTSEYLERNE